MHTGSVRTWRVPIDEIVATSDIHEADRGLRSAFLERAGSNIIIASDRNQQLQASGSVSTTVPACNFETRGSNT